MCSTNINNYMDNIDQYKICSNCKQSLNIDEFRIFKEKRTNKIKVNSYCKQCCTILFTKRAKNLKQTAVIYKGGKCNNCGYDKCLSALEFHHVDPSKKDFNYQKDRSFKSQKNELDKTILVCANCHREIHEKMNSLK